MKFKALLNDILGSKAKVKTLRFLITTNSEQAGREIARNVGLAQRITHQVLSEFWRNGLVRMRHVGRAKLYKINIDNLLIKKGLLPLFSLETNMLKSVGDKISSRLKKDALSIILFGSIASGEEKPNSDIDILIVARDDANIDKMEAAIDTLSQEFSREFGNLLSPIIIRKRDFIRRFLKRDKFIRNIIDTGKIIYGEYLMEMIHA